jgi:TolA-binding protein
MRFALLAILFAVSYRNASSQTTAKDLYDQAARHFVSGQAEISSTEYAEFLIRYPMDPNASEAQSFKRCGR